MVYSRLRRVAWSLLGGGPTRCALASSLSSSASSPRSLRGLERLIARALITKYEYLLSETFNMAIEFSKTLRSIREDRASRSTFALAVALVLFGAWSAWLVASRLPVYVTSSEARVEIDRVAHPVQAPFAGRVERADMRLGSTVRAGDILVELDAEPQRLELAGGRARREALRVEIEAAKRQLGAQQLASATQRSSSGVSVAEARARSREAEVAASEAEETLVRTERLAGAGVVSRAEASRAASDREQKAAARDATRFAAGRVAISKRLDVHDRQVQIGALERSIAALEGEVLSVESTIARLGSEVTRRVIRAPVDGVLVDMVPLTEGTVVKAGDRLAVVLPAGNLRAVAELAPPDALGRVQPGQRARLRLEGFPWAEHGTVSATITRVSGEVRDNRVRVELAIDPAQSRIPLQHGLPGVAEIEVERISPAGLVLRNAGHWLDGPRPAQVPAQAAQAAAPARTP